MKDISLLNPAANVEQPQNNKSHNGDFNLAWNLLVELRKETLETQKIRAQAIGFKITFLSTTVGLIFLSKAPVELLTVPAFSAIFFDILIVSYSITIKRIGIYCRSYLEPALKSSSKDWTDQPPLWEEFLHESRKKERDEKELRTFGNLPLVGNAGLTSLAVLPAMSVLLHNSDLFASLPIVVILSLLFVYDVSLFLYPPKIIGAEISGDSGKDGRGDNWLRRPWTWLGGKF